MCVCYVSVCACVCASNFVLFLGGERVGVRLREVYILIFMYSILPKICASVCVCVGVNVARVCCGCSRRATLF